MSSSAQEGRLEVVHELVRRFGIDGCSFDGDIEALDAAAFVNHTDVVAFQCDSGVVDTEARSCAPQSRVLERRA